MLIQIIPVAEASVSALMKSVNKVIINPLIIFVFALAVAYFLFGITKYLLNPENQDIRKASKTQMIYGILGMFIMVSVFGIMNILLTTLDENRIQVDNGSYSVGEMVK